MTTVVDKDSEPTWLYLPAAPSEATASEASGIKRSYSTDEFDGEDDKTKIRRLEAELSDAKHELGFLTGLLTGLDKERAAEEEEAISEGKEASSTTCGCSFADCGFKFPNSWSLVKHIREFHFTNVACTGCDAKFTDPWSLRRHVKKEHTEGGEECRKDPRDGVLTQAATEELGPSAEEEDGKKEKSD